MRLRKDRCNILKGCCQEYRESESKDKDGKVTITMKKKRKK